MNCSCNAMSLDDNDSHFSERYRVAAKDSVCPECNSKIEKGDLYLFGTLFIDGTIRNYKMCLICETVVKQFFQDGYYIGQIWEDLFLYFDGSWVEDLPSSCLSKLHPVARDRACDLLQRYQAA